MLNAVAMSNFGSSRRRLQAWTRGVVLAAFMLSNLVSSRAVVDADVIGLLRGETAETKLEEDGSELVLTLPHSVRRGARPRLSPARSHRVEARSAASYRIHAATRQLFSSSSFDSCHLRC